MNIFKPSSYIIFFIINILFYIFYDFDKVHFEKDNMFGFYPLFGFISCIALIIISKFLGYILKKDERYYDE